MKEKVILAYSGGLDTTAIIHGSKKILIMSHLLLHRLRTGQRVRRVWKREQRLSGASKLYIETW